MKLSPRDAPAYFAKPDPGRPGLLIYGADAMRVALRRQEVIAALLGPKGEEEMRLTRLSGAELRKDPAILDAAMKAQGFFPGQRVAFLEEANDGVLEPVAAALEEWQPGDAVLIVTAGALKPTSKLRKLFEGHKGAYVAAIYDDPPSRAEIETALKTAGLGQISGDAMRDLDRLAEIAGIKRARQGIEIALYKLGDSAPLSSEDIALCAPASVEAELDDILHIVAEARPGEVGPVMKRLRAQGVQPVGLCMAASRHFRALYTAASDPGGVAKGMASLRPPVFGPRRDRMQRQAQNWGAVRLEEALTMITDTDLMLRSAGQTAPPMAVLERTLIRLSMMPRA